MCGKDNFEIFIENTVRRKYVLEHRPVHLVLGLTNVCNLHCAFCPYCGFCMAKTEKRQELSVELLEELRPYLENAQFINPSGRGEPFLYRNLDRFIEICRECHALGKMHLTNNGTQLDKYDLSKLEGTNIIAVSIDSTDAAVFEILRCGAELEKVLRNTALLRAALPDTVLQWSVVVSRLNLFQLTDIYKKAAEYGINYITFKDVYGCEEDRVIQLLRLRESDRIFVEEQFRRIEQLNQDKKIMVHNLISWNGFEDGQALNQEEIFRRLEEMKSMEPYLDFDRLNAETGSRRVKYENRKGISGSVMRLPYCISPFVTMLIQPDQSVSPCCASYGVVGRIENNDIEAVWNSRNYQRLREAMFNWDMLPDYCLKCEAFERYDHIDAVWSRIKAFDVRGGY